MGFKLTGMIAKLKKTLRQGLKVQAWTIQVKGYAGQSENLTVLFAGHPSSKEYFKDLLSGNKVEERSMGTRWVWALPFFKRSACRQCGLAVFEGGIWFKPLLAGTQSFMMPIWVDGRVVLEPEFIKKVFKRRKVQYEVGKIKRNGFQYQVVKDEKWLRFFYQRMYLPHLEKHYGKLALVTSYAEIESRYRRYDGKIFFVKDGGDYVAGMVLIHTAKGVVMDKVAVLDGDDRHLRSGASAALYYYCIRYLLEAGERFFWLGGSRPFLNDGVLNYKQKWGLEVHGRHRHFFFLWPVKLDAAVMEFLAGNPFIFLKQGKLAGAVFLKDQDEQKVDLDWLQRRYHARGLSSLVVFKQSAAETSARLGVEAVFKDSG